MTSTSRSEKASITSSRQGTRQVLHRPGKALSSPPRMRFSSAQAETRWRRGGRRARRMRERTSGSRRFSFLRRLFVTAILAQLLEKLREAVFDHRLSAGGVEAADLGGERSGKREASVSDRLTEAAHGVEVFALLDQVAPRLEVLQADEFRPVLFQLPLRVGGGRLFFLPLEVPFHLPAGDLGEVPGGRPARHPARHPLLYGVQGDPEEARHLGLVPHLVSRRRFLPRPRPRARGRFLLHGLETMGTSGSTTSPVLRGKGPTVPWERES